MVVKSGLEFFILKFTEPLQSCCCPVQKYLPGMAELARQLSRYLWRGSVNFKITQNRVGNYVKKQLHNCWITLLLSKNFCVPPFQFYLPFQCTCWYDHKSGPIVRLLILITIAHMAYLPHPPHFRFRRPCIYDGVAQFKNFFSFQ